MQAGGEHNGRSWEELPFFFAHGHVEPALAAMFKAEIGFIQRYIQKAMGTTRRAAEMTGSYRSNLLPGTSFWPKMENRLRFPMLLKAWENTKPTDAPARTPGWGWIRRG